MKTSFIFCGCGRGGEASLYEEEGGARLYVYIDLDGGDYRFEVQGERKHFLDPVTKVVVSAENPKYKSIVQKAVAELESAWRRHMDTAGVIPWVYLA